MRRAGAACKPTLPKFKFLGAPAHCDHTGRQHNFHCFQCAHGGRQCACRRDLTLTCLRLWPGCTLAPALSAFPNGPPAAAAAAAPATNSGCENCRSQCPRQQLGCLALQPAAAVPAAGITAALHGTLGSHRKGVPGDRVASRVAPISSKPQKRVTYCIYKMLY